MIFARCSGGGGVQKIQFGLIIFGEYKHGSPLGNFFSKNEVAQKYF